MIHKQKKEKYCFLIAKNKTKNFFLMLFEICIVIKPKTILNISFLYSVFHFEIKINECQ